MENDLLSSAFLRLCRQPGPGVRRSPGW
jgi:hypothetical protein